MSTTSELVTLLIQIGAAEAPAIIAAAQSKGATVHNVGPVLQQDAEIIAADLAQLAGEQQAPGS